jgi:hypothetical protein
MQDWGDKAKENEAAPEEELARVQQEIESFQQEQESIMRRQAIAQCIQAHRQHINRVQVRLVELQYTVDILHQQEQRHEAPLDHIHYQPNAKPPPPSANQIPTNHLHHTTISSTNHHLHRISAPQIKKAHWPNTYNSHHDPCITEQSHNPCTMATLTPANFSCATKPQ